MTGANHPRPKIRTRALDLLAAHCTYTYIYKYTLKHKYKYKLKHKYKYKYKNSLKQKYKYTLKNTHTNIHKNTSEYKYKPKYLKGRIGSVRGYYQSRKWKEENAIWCEG